MGGEPASFGGCFQGPLKGKCFAQQQGQQLESGFSPTLNQVATVGSRVRNSQYPFLVSHCWGGYSQVRQPGASAKSPKESFVSTRMFF